MKAWDSIYRTNTPPPSEPKKIIFKKAYPKVFWLSRLLIGMCLSLALLWILFPGAYKTGRFFGMLMGWGEPILRDTPLAWFIGLMIFVVPFLFYWLSSFLGKEILGEK